MKIRPAVAELFRANGQTDRREETTPKNLNKWRTCLSFWVFKTHALFYTQGKWQNITDNTEQTFMKINNENCLAVPFYLDY